MHHHCGHADHDRDGSQTLADDPAADLETGGKELVPLPSPGPNAEEIMMKDQARSGIAIANAITDTWSGVSRVGTPSRAARNTTYTPRRPPR
jgi:hypothetical protein